MGIEGEIHDDCDEILTMMSIHIFYEDDDGIMHVPDEWACPSCGESEMDKLILDAFGEVVTCAECDTQYNPVGGQDARE